VLVRRPPAGNCRQIDFAQEAYQVYFGRRFPPARADTSNPRPHESGGTLSALPAWGRGFVCDSIDEMVAAVGSLGEIDRASCRHRVEMLFSAEAMAEGYEWAYAARLNDDRAVSAAPGGDGTDRSTAPGRGWPEREVG
jgi:hypothetical protein